VFDVADCLKQQQQQQQQHSMECGEGQKALGCPFCRQPITQVVTTNPIPNPRWWWSSLLLVVVVVVSSSSWCVSIAVVVSSSSSSS